MLAVLAYYHPDYTGEGIRLSRFRPFLQHCGIAGDVPVFATTGHRTGSTSTRVLGHFGPQCVWAWQAATRRN